MQMKSFSFRTKSYSVFNEHFKYAPLAQLVEQLTLNQWVQGSSPWRCTKNCSTCDCNFLPLYILISPVGRLFVSVYRKSVRGKAAGSQAVYREIVTDDPR